MKIPILTRKQNAFGNPGDTLIGYGLMYLLSEVVDDPHFVLVDKFSAQDLAAHMPVLRETGYLFYAGTPQFNNYDDWMLWYDWDLYKDFLIPNNIKMLSVAAGAGFPDNKMTPSQFADRCMGSPRTKEIMAARASCTRWLAVRDPHAHELLRALGIETEVLPCTALWANKWFGYKPSNNQVVGLVPASHKMINPQLLGLKTHEQCRDWQIQYLDKLKDQAQAHGHETKVICHTLDDYLSLRDHHDCVLTTELSSLVRVYSELDGVISLRLHAAMPVAGMGKRSTLLSIDTRAGAASAAGVPVVLAGESPDVVWKTYEGSAGLGKKIMTTATARYKQLLAEALELVK